MPFNQYSVISRGDLTGNSQVKYSAKFFKNFIFGGSVNWDHGAYYIHF